jgi:1,2-dihydroxy-3-keto-5-methylthiopentene dioxygenase
MAIVKIYNNPSDFVLLEDLTEIQESLKEINIDIAKWHTLSQLAPDASQEQVLQHYQKEVLDIKDKHGFKGVDVIVMHPNMPVDKITELRNKFLSEHIHSDDEVRYFVEGQGLFCIHGANSKIYLILCQQGDFIAVPAGIKHWFDMGSKPNFKCIRFFGDERGWIAEYTGDDIARKYPTIENFSEQYV